MPSRSATVPVAPPSPVESQLQNKFLLVVLAVQRARQLHNGARPRIDSEGHKELWVATNEVGAGRISWSVAEKLPASDAAPGKAA
jgi:DNA-directed RNA polymerase omega subunit